VKTERTVASVNPVHLDVSNPFRQNMQVPRRVVEGHLTFPETVLISEWESRGVVDHGWKELLFRVFSSS
jgi:hypothetical protein